MHRQACFATCQGTGNLSAPSQAHTYVKTKAIRIDIGMDMRMELRIGMRIDMRIEVRIDAYRHAYICI